MSRALCILVLLTACHGNAAEENLDALYDVSTQGSSTTVKAGEEGRLVLAIQTQGDTHVSDEAPISVQLAGKDLAWSRSTLGRADVKKDKSVKPGQPRFEAPFRAIGAGPAIAEADLTFFLCTKEVCARQHRKVSLPVTVQPAKP